MPCKLHRHQGCHHCIMACTAAHHTITTLPLAQAQNREAGRGRWKGSLEILDAIAAGAKTGVLARQELRPQLTLNLTIRRAHEPPQVTSYTALTQRNMNCLVCTVNFTMLHNQQCPFYEILKAQQLVTHSISLCTFSLTKIQYFSSLKETFLAVWALCQAPK